jgi:hypothetical protein
MDLQIDDFYKDIANALLTLYQAFPRRAPLYVEDLIGREAVDEFGLPSKRHLSCLGALLWLADEHYLRYETRIHYEAIDQAVLTEKSLVRLTRLVGQPEASEMPAGVMRIKSSMAHQMREALADQNSESIAKAVRAFLTDTDQAPIKHL